MDFIIFKLKRGKLIKNTIDLALDFYQDDTKWRVSYMPSLFLDLKHQALTQECRRAQMIEPVEQQNTTQKVRITDNTIEDSGQCHFNRKVDGTIAETKAKGPLHESDIAIQLYYRPSDS